MKPRDYALRLLDELRIYEEELRSEVYMQPAQDVPCEITVVVRWANPADWEAASHGDLIRTKVSVFSYPAGTPSETIDTLTMAVEKITTDDGETEPALARSLDDDTLGQLSLPPGKKPN